MEPRLALTKDEDGVSVNATDYRRLIGSLRYLIHSRPDLSYSVGVVSRYMESPNESHLKAVKHILMYIKGTTNFGLVYKKGGNRKLIGFSDSNYGMDVDGRKGTTGMVFYFSGNPITWSSQKQQTVALSSCEAEFMVATATACQALWLRSLLKELTGWKEESVRMKQIDVKHISGEEQRADPLTKALPRPKFLEMRDLLGVIRLEDKGGESSSSVHDAQYFDDIIGEHVDMPDVHVQLIPFKGLIFKSLKLAIKMYSEYAEIGGFDKKKSCDTLGTSGVRRKQNSNSRAIGCQAKIIFESVYGTPDYKVFQFDELHNHLLEKRSDLKKARQMSYSEKEFIVHASTSKIGPTMAHKLRASLRDVVLDCMFWADEMEKTYYAEFGDIISFDATFQTNKYRMFFVPFTAIDHHKKSVTVGSGLLSNESIESYSWLLKAFLKTDGKEPTLVLTDQDAAIKQVVENVFHNSKH
ncbi:hypothetical protein Lser_V15G11935 [Lactuca serriola]